MIYSIQLLRFFAAALVLLNHCMDQFGVVASFGSFGVDIFFVISGFIMSHVTEKGSDNFFSRRLIRIVPQYWLFTIGISAVAFAGPSLLRKTQFSIEHILYSLFFIPHWNSSGNHWPIFGLGWTLNFEIFFYMVFSISMIFSHKHREIVCASAMMFIYIAISFWNPEKELPVSFYMNSIIFEFVFGLAIGLFFRKGLIGIDILRIRHFIVAVLTTLLAYYYFIYISTDNDPRFVIFGIPALFLVIASLLSEGAFRALAETFREKILIAGEISYPLYLLHIYVIAFLSRVLHNLHLNITLLFAITLPLSCILAHIVSNYFDLPIRRRLSKLLPR